MGDRAGYGVGPLEEPRHRVERTQKLEVMQLGESWALCLDFTKLGGLVGAEGISELN